MTRQQYADIRRHATRKARYGPSGATATGRASWVQNMRRVATTAQHGSQVIRQAPTCRRGHPWTAHNTLIEGQTRPRRRCRACRDLQRRGRPRWVERQGVRISVKAHDAFALREYRRLRDHMLAAHPDKGGRHFIKAKERLDRFVKQERAWYAAYQVAPPPPLYARIRQLTVMS